MKNLLLPLISAIFSVAPALADNFSPQPSPNPWPDDYRHISSMDNWKEWGTYNVHDPSCRKIGDYYYMYSTDAIYRENRKEAAEKNVPLGFIQMRRSKDLVNWEFLGWVFPEIPAEAVEWVHSNTNGEGATNIWAPYIVDCGNGSYRLYYCVSAFGKNTSYIGMATASSPQGPWRQAGEVVKTAKDSKMNAIDPSVATDAEGRQWMHYGSYFGGLYCLELDPATGLALIKGDQGHLVARRANWRKDNLEAPEIFQNRQNGKYYLFQSYDPLMTTYNVRVGRADKAEGPFIDFKGKEIADTTNNFPILTAPYRFENHPGWVGTAHCGVFDDGQGNIFMAHQGRLATDAGMMDLHIRQVFFTPEGWPVVSPERYTALPARQFTEADLEGEWEIIRVLEPRAERNLEAGQILWGEGDLLDGEWNNPSAITILAGGKAIASAVAANSAAATAADSSNSATSTIVATWKFNPATQLMDITLGNEKITDLIIHHGHDWERETDTILFTGLDSTGRSVWGKRIR